LIRNEALQQFTDKEIKESNQIMIKKICLQNFNQLKIRFNRLFTAEGKTELKQTIIRSEREREREFYKAKFILVHSTLRYI